MTTPSILLAGNWKLNFGPRETRDYFKELSSWYQPKANATLRLYVPDLSLQTALDCVNELNLKGLEIGAQNAYSEASGAFTGETSPTMLKEIGIEQVLIGHSERRQLFGETVDGTLKRTEGCLKNGLAVLLCIGETLKQREQNQTESVLSQQLEPFLKSSSCADSFGKTLHIAYEPVWAIGTGLTATPEQAEAAHAFIRSMLKAALATETSASTKILYGGSVKPENFAELIECPNIDGGLVGGASLKNESWKQLWSLI